MRPFSSLSLLQLLLAATTATASSSVVSPPPSTSITFQIGVPSRVQEQDKESAAVALLSSIPGWTRATLESGDGRQYVSAPITAGGKLVFANVTAGSYLGEVHCSTHIFSPLRVDVEEEGTAATDSDANLLVTRITETYRGNDWANQGEVLQRVLPVKVGGASAHSGVSLTSTGPTFLVAPLVLQTKSYYSERSSFDVLSLLKNPMILMAIVALVMMVGMPYMMDQSKFPTNTPIHYYNEPILTVPSGPRDARRVRGAPKVEPDEQHPRRRRRRWPPGCTRQQL